MSTLLLVKCDLCFNDIFVFLLYLRVTVVSLALGFFKSFFVRSFFFCSLKSFLNGDSSGNIYYLYDEIIVSILVEIFFFRFSLELSSLLEGFLQIWVGFTVHRTCFPTVWIVFVHFFNECFTFYPAFSNGFIKFRSDLIYFLQPFGKSSSLFQ